MPEFVQPENVDTVLVIGCTDSAQNILLFQNSSTHVTLSMFSGRIVKADGGGVRLYES